MVRAAREEELKVVDEMGVWELRPIAECIEVTGKKPFKVRWVDVNKGDDVKDPFPRSTCFRPEGCCHHNRRLPRY